MIGIGYHKRLRNWRDAAIRRAKYRPVYAHALVTAHIGGHLIADDHPGWARIEGAIARARAGEPDAIDSIEREVLRMRDKHV
jgi:hypothetical protein